ncbi:MAG: VWA domain-containing protein [Planctomycetaceae bacterium]|nr:VWA domain-containing protein [Planctomycetaceae bacterium]
MSFAAPAALALTALALPIIAFYVLKVRLRRIPVSTNLFWKQVYEDKPPRSLWQNLRHLLSLFCQLFLLGLLVLAVADPYLSGQALQARRLVFVLDASASMKATDVSPTRFDAARSAAMDVLDGLRFRDEAAVVVAGSRPEVILGMAGHVPTLRRAIDSVQPSDSVAALDQAIELAKQLIGDHANGQILVFTDSCAQRPDNSVQSSDLTNLLANDSSVSSTSVDAQNQDVGSSEEPEKSSETEPGMPPVVVYHTFATPAANIGITQFQARRSMVDPIGYEVLVTVTNAADAPVKARVELELDGITVDVIPLNLAAEESWSKSIEKTSLEGGVLRAALTRVQSESATDARNLTAVGDGAGSDNNERKKVERVASVNSLLTDDVAWALIPPRIVQDVVIVSPGSFFLERVFRANPLVNVSVVDELPESWPNDAILVFHRLLPSTLPNSPVMVIDPDASCNLWELEAEIENPVVTEQDDESPLMTHIRMDNVLMPSAKKLKFKLPVQALASTISGEPVYAALNRPGGRKGLVLNVNLESSDLAFRTAFPILITNALSWFAGQTGELQPAITAGQSARLRRDNPAERPETNNVDSLVTKSGASSDLVLISPSDRKFRVASQQVGPLDEVGIWSVSIPPSSPPSGTDSGETGIIRGGEGIIPVQQFAVNLASSSESDLRPVTSGNDGSSPLNSSWLTRPVWFYLAVCACVFCVLEWFLYQRRFIT